VGAELTGEGAVEQVGALAFQSSERGGGAISGWPRNVDIAMSVVNVFWSSWRSAVLAIGVEGLAHQEFLQKGGPRKAYAPISFSVGPPTVAATYCSPPTA
jgi:hypothetical protein